MKLYETLGPTFGGGEGEFRNIMKFIMGLMEQNNYACTAVAVL